MATLKIENGRITIAMNDGTTVPLPSGWVRIEAGPRALDGGYVELVIIYRNDEEFWFKPWDGEVADIDVTDLPDGGSREGEGGWVVTRLGNAYTLSPDGFRLTRYGDEAVSWSPPRTPGPTSEWLMDLEA